MHISRRLLTANRLIQLLYRIGVPRTMVANELDIGRTTVFNWQNAEKSPDSPVLPPTDEQLSALSQMLLRRLREQHRRLLSLLAADDIRLTTKREIVEGLLDIYRQALEQMESISATWAEMDRDLEQLTDKYGPEFFDRLADTRKPSNGVRFMFKQNHRHEPEVNKPLQDEETKVEIPPALVDKQYRYKYQAVLDVLQHASVDASASELAAQVRRLYPKGTFLPYRIGEDIGHLLRGDGVYAKYAPLPKKQAEHLERLLANLKERGELGR